MAEQSARRRDPGIRHLLLGRPRALPCLVPSKRRHGNIPSGLSPSPARKEELLPVGEKISKYPVMVELNLHNAWMMIFME